MAVQQGTDASLTAHLVEEISSYVGKITSGLLHITDYPPELENTFLKITDMFNATSGPFAIIEHEWRNTTDFYANCYNNVRMFWTMKYGPSGPQLDNRNGTHLRNLDNANGDHLYLRFPCNGAASEAASCNGRTQVGVG